jgi:hypothetical protein
VRFERSLRASAQSIDDLARTVRIAHNAREVVARFVDRRHRAIKPAHARLTVRNDRHERLLEVVSERRRQFAQRRNTRDMREFRLRAQQRVLRLMDFRHVGKRTHVFHGARSGRDGPRHHAQIFERARRHLHAVLDLDNRRALFGLA